MASLFDFSLYFVIVKLLFKFGFTTFCLFFVKYILRMRKMRNSAPVFIEAILNNITENTKILSISLKSQQRAKHLGVKQSKHKVFLLEIPRELLSGFSRLSIVYLMLITG